MNSGLSQCSKRENGVTFPGWCLEDWDRSDRCERDLGSENSPLAAWKEAEG